MPQTKKYLVLTPLPSKKARVMMGWAGCYCFAFESYAISSTHTHSPLNLEDVLQLYSNSLSLGSSLSRRCTQQLTTNSLSLGREELTVGEAFCQRRRPSLWKTIIGELPNYIQHHLLPHVFVFVFEFVFVFVFVLVFVPCIYIQHNLPHVTKDTKPGFDWPQHLSINAVQYFFVIWVLDN